MIGTELTELKKDNLANFEQIKKEDQLTGLVHDEIESELEATDKHEPLNNEKMTPTFLKILTCSQNFASLEDICSENGEEFPTHFERTEYIGKYYKNLYKEPEIPNQRQTICEFLGDDILNNPLVQNSLLTGIELDSFEINLSLEELD